MDTSATQAKKMKTGGNSKEGEETGRKEEEEANIPKDDWIFQMCLRVSLLGVDESMTTHLPINSESLNESREKN